MMIEAVLAVHVAIILFNMFGLVAVPVGAIRDWRFVHIRWWRVLHVLSLAAVAAQALAGRLDALRSDDGPQRLQNCDEDHP